MAKTVVALYDNVDDAQTTVRELIDHGVSRDRISLVANNPDRPGQAMKTQPGQETPPVEQPAPREGEPSNVDADAKAGAGIGAVLGGIGGLLVGLGALAIPGIGPVLAAGPLAAALGGVAGAGTGAIAGAAAGGLVGALSEMGVNEEHAGYYAEGIRRGGTLVAIQTDDEDVAQARRLMNEHHPVDINERGTQWRQSGWSGFQPGPQPEGKIESKPEATYERNKPAEPTPQNEFVESVYEKNAGLAGPQPEGEIESKPEATYERDEPREHTAQNEFVESVYEKNVAIEAGKKGPSGAPDYSNYEDDFRSHFNSMYSGHGVDYNRFTPAYQYGLEVASMEGFRGSDWTQVEPQARRQWEMDHPDTPWEEVKSAVHHAWSRAQHPNV